MFNTRVHKITKSKLDKLHNDLILATIKIVEEEKAEEQYQQRCNKLMELSLYCASLRKSYEQQVQEPPYFNGCQCEFCLINKQSTGFL